MRPGTLYDYLKEFEKKIMTHEDIERKFGIDDKLKIKLLEQELEAKDTAMGVLIIRLAELERKKQ